MLCLVCDKELKYFGDNSDLKIYKCRSCGLGKTLQESKTNYSEYHRDEVYTQEEKQFRNIFLKIFRQVSKYKKTGKILDVGSSTGLLLSIFKEQGWQVQGIEPSKAAFSESSKKGIPTKRGTFEKEEFTNQKFDVVIFDHVLEHMENPQEVLKKTHRLLNKDGVVVVNVPNFASLSAKLNGARWEYVLPNEHLWHFTPEALKKLLNKEGFDSLSWEARSGIWDYENPLLELWQSLIEMKKRFFKNVLTALPTLFITLTNNGTGLSVIAKKV